MIETMSDTAHLTVGDQSIDIPVITGSEGEKALDISNLRSNSGYITYDVGYKNTGSTTSSITFLDGEKGILRYRGYSIEDLANKADFLEVTYLIINGELPAKDILDKFKRGITMHTLLHEDTKNIFEAYPTGSHPMGQLMAMISSLSSFYPESLNPYRLEDERMLSIIRLIAKMPTMCAMIYKKQMGHPIMYPKNELDYVANYLYMTFGNVTEKYEVDRTIVDALDKLLILHADHEQNCSTSTVRIVGSSHVNLYAAVSAGVAALWGPLHGGANQKVIEMLEAIKADGGNYQKWIDKAKDKNDPFLLMGFGHRVYKNFDPRARIIKDSADKVLAKIGIHDPILDIAKNLEETALNDDYFKERKLFPNVDFYSGIIYRAMGFPTEMFTVLFALGRLPGWIAQWKEMRDEKQPIGRPRQIYTGSPERKFVPIEHR